MDCSNRGICDYETGVCSCFDGYHGQARNEPPIVENLFVLCHKANKGLNKHDNVVTDYTHVVILESCLEHSRLQYSTKNNLF